MHIVTVKYYPNQTNPLHVPTGRGVWRVTRVLPAVGTWARLLFVGLEMDTLTIRTHMNVKRRSRVNPRHLLGV